MSEFVGIRNVKFGINSLWINSRIRKVKNIKTWIKSTIQLRKLSWRNFTSKSIKKLLKIFFWIQRWQTSSKQCFPRNKTQWMPWFIRSKWSRKININRHFNRPSRTKWRIYQSLWKVNKQIDEWYWWHSINDRLLSLIWCFVRRIDSWWAFVYFWKNE